MAPYRVDIFNKDNSVVSHLCSFWYILSEQFIFSLRFESILDIPLLGVQSSFNIDFLSFTFPQMSASHSPNLKGSPPPKMKMVCQDMSIEGGYSVVVLAVKGVLIL